MHEQVIGIGLAGPVCFCCWLLSFGSINGLARVAHVVHISCLPSPENNAGRIPQR
jgi:hypothetical protein